MAVGAAGAVVGCSTPEATYVGRPSSPIYATQSLGTLEAVLPEPMPVRSVLAAAEATLRDRGYTIWRRRTTDERGRVVARAPSRDLGGTWVVEAWAEGGGRTGLSVRNGAWDPEAGSRVMMDAILERLGR